MKNQKNHLNKRRLEILEIAKKIIPFEGWNENIMQSINDESNIAIYEIKALFPNGYKDLLKFYLSDLDVKMIKITSYIIICCSLIISIYIFLFLL